MRHELMFRKSVREVEKNSFFAATFRRVTAKPNSLGDCQLRDCCWFSSLIADTLIHH